MRMSLAALVLSVVCALAAVANAQTVITQWDFDAINAAGTGPFYTNTSPGYNNPPACIGTGTAIPLGMDNSYVFAVGAGIQGSTTSCDITNTSGIGDQVNFTATMWRVRGPATNTGPGTGNGWHRSAPEYTQGAQFGTSTVGFTGIKFGCVVYCTTQGVSCGQAQYTLNSSEGTPTWVSIGNAIYMQSNDFLSPLSGSLSISNPSVQLDFSSIAGASNNPNFAVRIVSRKDPRFTATSPIDYAAASSPTDTLYNNSSGNWRFGQITFSGTPTGPISPTISAINSAAAVCNSVDNDITFTVTVRSGINPASSGTTVSANLSQFGLGSTPIVFTGNPTGTIFTYTAHVPANTITVSGSPVTADATITVSDNELRSASTHSIVKFANCATGTSTSTVVISQVYGGGGNTDSFDFSNQGVYEADFVEIYNRSASPVSLTGWSVQYTSPTNASGFAAANASSNQVNLSGTIQPRQYMLIRYSDPVRGFGALPTPDFSTTYGLGGINSTGGRVVLSSSTAAVGTSTTSTNIKDFVGFGAAAITFEGAGPTPSPNNATAVIRKSTASDSNPGAQDTNQNFFDFVVGTPVPHNRSSNGTTTFLTAYASIPGTDSNAVVNAYGACTGSVVKFTVAVTPSNNPVSTGITVNASTTNITGTVGTVQLFDDGPAGNHGDALAGDGIYTLDYTIPANALVGAKAVTFTAADQTGSASSTLTINIANCTDSASPVVFTKIFGGGAHYDYVPNMDFAEIYNRSNAPVDMTGWLMEYQDANNTFTSTKTVALSGTIGAGERRLIAPQPVPGIGLAIPTPDFAAASPGFGFDNHFGRLALVKPLTPGGTAPILVTTGTTINAATAPAVVDLVGYGASIPTYEGVAPAGTLSNGTYIVRKNNGNQDFNQNLLDFDTLYILAVPQTTRSLTVTKNSSLTSTGTVTSDSSSSINCGTICSSVVDRGTFVSLTATAGPRSKFLGWSGACAGTAGCVVAVNDSTSVVANFGCIADFNNSGGIEIQDIFDFLNAWFAGSASADFNGGGLAVQDIFDFLNAWFAGC